MKLIKEEVIEARDGFFPEGGKIRLKLFEDSNSYFVEVWEDGGRKIRTEDRLHGMLLERRDYDFIKGYLSPPESKLTWHTPEPESSYLRFIKRFRDSSRP